MAYLLDTHIIIWLAHSPEKLSETVRQILMDKKQKVYFSTASIWEIAIKSALNKDNFQINATHLYRHLLNNSYLELPITAEQCLKVGELPQIHKDPFDHLLITQAISHNLTLISCDKSIAKYPKVNLLSF